VNRLLGRHHPMIRRLRALRRDPSKRRTDGVFLAEGIHLAQEAIDSAAPVELVVVSPALSATEEGSLLLQAVEQLGLNWVETSDAVLESLQDAHTPQPVLMLVQRPEWPIEAGMTRSDPTALIAVAHGVQDPGNFGAIVRTAHAAGATACFACGESADPFHPRAVRASMGSIFRLPVIATDIDDLMGLLKERNILTLGADVSGEVDYHRCDLTRPAAIFFGREGQGLPLEVLSDLDRRVRIPMRAGVDSLSVGAAAAVVLFHAALQRLDSKK